MRALSHRSLGVYGKGYRWAGPGFVVHDTAPWPARKPGFFGRAQEQGELRALLEQGAPRVAVVGPPGAGTSRLLEAVAPPDAAVLRWCRGWSADELRAGIQRRLGRPLDPAAPCLLLIDDLDPGGLSVVESVLAERASADGLRICALFSPKIPAISMAPPASFATPSWTSASPT